MESFSTTELKKKIHAHSQSFFDGNRVRKTLGRVHLAVGSVIGNSATKKVAMRPKPLTAWLIVSTATHPN